MLSSNDPVVSQIARAELLQTVRHASQSNPTPALVSNYLSSHPDDRLNSIRYRVNSLWTHTRKASKYIGITFMFNDSWKPSISSSDSSPVKATKACIFLHYQVQDFYSQQLLALPDQGKVARSLSTDYYANGSSWHITGLNMRFKDWRFIHRARLNCIPLNAPKSKWSNASSKCRHCESDETLPHVLCYCKPNMVMIRNRHNPIVNRLTNAVRSGEVITNCTVADTNSNLRPDIIIQQDNRVSIIDVCCPFDNNPEALSEAENRKLFKYEHLKQHFISKGLYCEAFGFVIGALGSWYPKEFSTYFSTVLRNLGMTCSYKYLFRKLCCTDVIQGSTNIYRKHLRIDD